MVGWLHSVLFRLLGGPGAAFVGWPARGGDDGDFGIWAGGVGRDFFGPSPGSRKAGWSRGGLAGLAGVT